jgi:hypothetical protein
VAASWTVGSEKGNPHWNWAVPVAAIMIYLSCELLARRATAGAAKARGRP